MKLRAYYARSRFLTTGAPGERKKGVSALRTALHIPSVTLDSLRPARRA
jgi:hypothetical protein